jgi:hypothetical protein
VHKQRENQVKFLKIIGVLVVIYIGIVILFESLIGYYQPAGGTTLVITTSDPDGTTYNRVLSRLDSDDKLYVAVNHWPRAWYHRTQENPEVQITMGEETGNYLAVPVSEEEHDRLQQEHPRGTVGTLLMGFAPRYFVRLDPR